MSEQINVLTGAPMQCACGKCDIDFGIVVKSFEGATDTDRVVHGMASCEDMDLQGEVVVQKGMDLRPLLDSGWVNWDHQTGPQFLIGKPLEAEVARIENHPVMMKSGLSGLGTYFKARLVKGLDAADGAWFHLQHPTEGRPLSWSVQGRTHERGRYAPGRIEACEVRHMALTHQPIQTKSFAVMAKSMALAKTMTAEGAAPLRLEHLDSPLTRVLWGDAGCGHFNYKGKFHTGRLGALNHMTKCLGHDLTHAHGFIKSLIESELIAA